MPKGCLKPMTATINYNHDCVRQIVLFKTAGSRDAPGAEKPWCEVTGDNIALLTCVSTMQHRSGNT